MTKEEIAKAYLDLTDVSKRDSALTALVSKGAIGQLQARLFKDSVKDIEKVYDGEELGEKLEKIYREIKQPTLYAINGEDVEPEIGLLKGNKFLKEFLKTYTR